MTRRKSTLKPKSKPKPTTSPLIEWPTKEVEQVPVTAEHKGPVRADETCHLETEQ
jgi:hypothetical protein